MAGIDGNIQKWHFVLTVGEVCMTTDHRERRTTKLGVNLFNKLGPLCEYTQLLRNTEWTAPIHLVHKTEVRYCISCNGWHWFVTELIEEEESGNPLLGWMQQTGYE
jgi:hypothetical protein